MTKKITLIALIFLFTIISKVTAQGKNSIEISPDIGVQMFSAEQNTLKGNFEGGEVVYHLSMANNPADWVKMLHVNDISFAASFRQMGDVYLVKQPGSKGILGDCYGITSRLDITLAQMGRSQLRFIPGFGFAYATQSFYTNNNPLVGSHINFTAQAGVKFITPVSSSTRLVAGLDIYHYSNAAVKLPNDGVNALNASVGIDHDLNVQGPGESKNMRSFKNYKRSAFEFGFNIGRRGLVQQGGGIDGQALIDYQKNAESKLYKSGFYAGYSYRLNPVLGLRLGTDAVYYYKTLDTIQNIQHFYATYQELASSYDKWRVGVSVGTDIWLGRVAFDINYGQYLHFHSYQGTYGFNPNPPNWYWTFGGKYFINQWLGIEVKQYLHRTEADYAGFGFIIKT